MAASEKATLMADALRQGVDLTVGGTGGLGYAAGTGGTVTQATNKTTGVTLSKMCGTITTHNASLAAGAEATFVVTNTLVAATDMVFAFIASGPATPGTYGLFVSTIAAGSFRLTLTNLTVGALAEAIVINFVVVKAVAA